MQPLISIIIPVYNAEKYLFQCLDSIKSQTCDCFEVICVNDGSTDKSLNILRQFASIDSVFSFISKENAGYGAAINTGIELSKGIYIGIIEPDDYIEPDMLETLFNAARENDMPDIVKGSYWRVLNSGSSREEIRPANFYHRIKTTNKPFKLEDDAEFLFHHPSIWSAIYRRDFIERNNIRMHEIPGAGWADNPWLMETLVKANSIVYVDKCIYFYRESLPGSSSIVSDPTIYCKRWLDMDDIVRLNGITSERILEGHYNRACAYLKEIQDSNQFNDPRIKEIAPFVLSRIDEKVVSESVNIRPEYKKAYFIAKGHLNWTLYRLKAKFLRVHR